MSLSNYFILKPIFSGHIDRKTYCFYFITSMFVFFAVVLALTEMQRSIGRDASMLLIRVVSIYYLVILFSIITRRLHDFGWGGFWSLIALVPVLNIVFYIALGFIKGTREKYIENESEPWMYEEKEEN